MTTQVRPIVKRDRGPQAIAFGTTLALHTCVVAGILWSSVTEAPAVTIEPPIWVDLYEELPKLGEERPKELMPRIVQAPLPEPAPQAPVNLNQEREEEPVEPVEKKPDPEEKTADQPDPEAEKREQEEKKRRKKELAEAMAKLDPRADEDSPEGLESGFKEGTSSHASTLREESLWAAQVGAKIREQLQPPAGISPGECRNLSAVIPIVLSATGKVVNAPEVKTSSGNGFFDDAAARALRFFTEDGRGVLPLPNAERLAALRKKVMREGVPVRLKCAQ